MVVVGIVGKFDHICYNIVIDFLFLEINLVMCIKYVYVLRIFKYSDHLSIYSPLSKKKKK